MRLDRPWQRAGAGRDDGVQVSSSLEEHNLGGAMLEAVNLHLEKRGIEITTGTIVSSTKNRKQKRDQEMHQTKRAISG